MTTTILIPGLVCDATVWEPLLDKLLNAVVADLTRQDTITDMALDCLALENGPLVVAGHSMGARVAMEMARIAPQRVVRLGLFDTGIHPLADGEISKRAEIVDFTNENGMQALVDRWLPPMVHTPNQEDTILMQNLTNMVLRQNADIHARHINALVNRPDASAYISEIKCPTLLVVGEHDQWSPVSQHQRMAAIMPNAHLEIVPNAGHFAPVERPQEFVRLVAPFLLNGI